MNRSHDSLSICESQSLRQYCVKLDELDVLIARRASHAAVTIAADKRHCFPLAWHPRPSQVNGSLLGACARPGIGRRISEAELDDDILHSLGRAVSDLSTRLKGRSSKHDLQC